MNEVLLVGNPNTGKTTLYNSITRSDEHVGNWHGVTVNSKSKKINYKQQDYIVTDLPGLYSLTSLTFEEQVSVDSIVAHDTHFIINICDINNLEKNLYLTLQLKEMGRDFILCINDTNTKKLKSSLDIKKLSQILGVDVIIANAQKSSSKILLESIKNRGEFSRDYTHLKELPVLEIANIIQPECSKLNLDSEWCAIKLLENDEKILKKLKINDKKLKIINNLKPNSCCSMIAKSRHRRIKEILNLINYKKIGINNKLNKLDKIVTHKVFGVLFFFAVMLLIFYLTFFSFGEMLSQCIRNLVDISLGKGVILLTQNCPTWVKELFSVGLVGGISNLMGFLPQIVLLFLFLSILEETGYMSRVAFLFDDIFAKIGLSGKSMYTLLMGFGCSTTAIMTARNMEDKNSQIKTAMLAPYMSCSAKLPIYIVIGGVFFKQLNLFFIFFLYLLGIVVSVLMSYIFNKTILKSTNESLILEFPDIKVPGAKKILKTVWRNFSQFIVRVGTVLIFVNIIVWVLQSFSFRFEYVAVNGGKSMLEEMGGFLSPIFNPLGFGSWGAVSALIAGVIAKEIIISSICIFNGISSQNLTGNNNISQSLLDPLSPVCFTPASCVSFLVFCLLYCPCLSSLVVLRKEIGVKWTFIAVIIQLLVAYLTAFIIYTIFLLFTTLQKWQIITFVAIGIIVISLIVTIINVKKHRTCDKSDCSKCEGLNCHIKK